MSMKKSTKCYLQTYGRRKIRRLGYRDSWAFISYRRHLIGEALMKSPHPGGWGTPVEIAATVKLAPQVTQNCNWGEEEEMKRRENLCNRYEGYGDVCNCKSSNMLGL